MEKEDIPAYLNYGSNPRVGDIIVLPDLGWLVEEGNKTLPGAHGFDPTYDDMQVMFRACGPDFKKDTKLRSSEMYRFIPCWPVCFTSLPRKQTGIWQKLRAC